MTSKEDKKAAVDKNKEMREQLSLKGEKFEGRDGDKRKLPEKLERLTPSSKNVFKEPAAPFDVGRTAQVDVDWEAGCSFSYDALKKAIDNDEKEIKSLDDGDKLETDALVKHLTNENGFLQKDVNGLLVKIDEWEAKPDGEKIPDNRGFHNNNGYIIQTVELYKKVFDKPTDGKVINCTTPKGKAVGLKYEDSTTSTKADGGKQGHAFHYDTSVPAAEAEKWAGKEKCVILHLARCDD